MRKWPEYRDIHTMILLFFVVVFLAACEQSTATQATVSVQASSGSRTAKPEYLALGQKVYQDHCAACHGDNAQGAPHWRQRDASGYWPAPPLNGTGHSWHHPGQDLRKKIVQGALSGEGRMPGWGNRLEAKEIDAVITWFQSLWPEKIHQIWSQRETNTPG